MAKRKKTVEAESIGSILDGVSADHGGFDVDGLRKTVVGLPIPYYSERFLRDSDKYIIGKIEQYVGDPGSGKTAYGLHVGGQFVDAGGYFFIVETENKISPSSVEANLGTERIATGRVKLIPAASLDMKPETGDDGEEAGYAWQQIVKSIIDKASLPAVRKVPVYILVDSILGASTKEMEDAYEDNHGVMGGRTTAHMARANSIGMWINITSSRIAGTNILLGFTNHKSRTIPMGAEARFNKPKDTYGGGEKLKFQTALAIKFERGSDKTSTNEAGRSVKLSIMKNSFGGEERKMDLIGTYRTILDEGGTPLRDKDGYPRRTLYWDWDEATAMVLYNHGCSDGHRYAAAAGDLLGIRKSTKSAFTCGPLSLERVSPVAYGKAVDASLDYQLSFMVFNKLSYNHYGLAEYTPAGPPPAKASWVPSSSPDDQPLPLDDDDEGGEPSTEDDD